nr:hypothetical protein [Gracilaria vermiculophylla]
MHHINTNVYSFVFAKNVFSSSYQPHSSSINQSLVRRPFIGKLINKYWQEKIFLSIPSVDSEKYINQLKSEGILVCKNEQKKFLLDFSKSLLSGRIETSLNFSNTNSKKSPYLSYIWKKGFNFAIPKKITFPLFHDKTLSLNKEQVNFLRQLDNQPVPLFLVVNHFNQMILADSTETIVSNSNILDQLYRWYYNKFLLNEQNRPIYYGLFFINPMDAKEYMKYISRQHKFSSGNDKFNLFLSPLSIYYKFTRINLSNVQFRIIPDLEEISRLLYRYRYYRNLKFYKYQKYGKSFFQGQPIYIIEPFSAYDKKNGKVKLLNYYYGDKFNLNHSNKEFSAIFTNYVTLLKAWKKFKQKHVEYNIPSKPKVLIYNLEDFIKKNEYNSNIKDKNILLIPSQTSYQFIKHYQFVNKDNRLKRIFSNKFLSLKILSQRIIWSLTTRQPINW